MRPLSVLSPSEDATREIGRALGKVIMPPLTILLHGDLGTGKTVLVRGIGDALRVTGVRSPSFTLINEYRVGDTNLALAHVDLYRLEDASSVDALGLDELVGSRDSILIVEWPERWSSQPVSGTLRVEIAAPDESSRLMTFCPYGEEVEAMVEEFSAGLTRSVPGLVYVTRETVPGTGRT